MCTVPLWGGVTAVSNSATGSALAEDKCIWSHFADAFFSHVSTMRTTPRFWESLLQLASAVLVTAHIMVDACSPSCSAKKYYFEVQKPSSMALNKQIQTHTGREQHVHTSPEDIKCQLELEQFYWNNIRKARK